MGFLLSKKFQQVLQSVQKLLIRWKKLLVKTAFVITLGLEDTQGSKYCWIVFKNSAISVTTPWSKSQSFQPQMVLWKDNKETVTQD